MVGAPAWSDSGGPKGWEEADEAACPRNSYTSTKEGPSTECILRRKQKFSSRVCKQRTMPEMEERNSVAMPCLSLGVFTPALINMAAICDEPVAMDTE